MAAARTRSAVTVHVAAWGPAFGYPELPVFDGEQFADQGPEVHYAHRAKVLVRVPSDTSYGAIIDEAADRFGVLSQNEMRISELVHCVALYRDADERGMAYDYDRWLAVVRTVDRHGAPSWAVRWSEVTVDEMLAARDAGVLLGDPLRPYFWPVIPQGDLDDLAQALWMLWMHWEDILTHILAAGGTAALARSAVRRTLQTIRRARTSAAVDHQQWAAALRRPREFFAYLTDSARTSEEVAQHTGLRLYQVERGLPGLGYVLGPDARWRPATGAQAQLAEAVRDIEKRGRAPSLEETAERVRALARADELRPEQP